MADHPQWPGISSEQIQQLLHSPEIVAQITALANKLCDAANSIDPTPANSKKQHGPNFAVTVQNSPSTRRPRAYVRPVGKTGLHVEAGQSVLMKAIGTMEPQ